MKEDIITIDIQDCKIPFDWWFFDCLMAGIDNPQCPDNYILDLDNCQEWKDKYNIGMTPKEAVNSKFCKH